LKLEEVEKAAKEAGAHDFISNKDFGYDTVVDDNLSGGERQRILLGRTILANKPILILDEFTSAQDSKTEAELYQTLENVWQKKTVIAVMHRLTAAPKFDRIIVFQNGKICEDGSHEQLLEKDNLYADLWKASISQTK